VGAPLNYKSETKPWVSTAGARLQFQTSAIPKQGPNGGRIVIDRITAHFQGNVDVATAALLGADFYRFFRTVTVKQRDGALRYNEVPGDAMRVFLFEAIGGDRTKEHADSGTTAGQTLTATCVIPMGKRYMHTPDDYALPAELLNYVEIGCGSSSEMSLGSSVVTINSGNYWLIFECHEDMDIVQYAVDEVRVQDFESTTSQEARLNVHGRLRDLLLFVRGASGGASLANLTSAGISQPQNMAPTDMLLNPDLKERFARERNEVTGAQATTGNPIRSNPFINSTTRAAAVLIPSATSAFEQPETDTAVVKTVHTLAATLTAVMRIAKPRSEATRKAIAQKYGLTGEYRVKTQSKTMRAAQAWKPEHLAYMPIKFTRRAG
jgi:hypothetical protein